MNLLDTMDTGTLMVLAQIGARYMADNTYLRSTGPVIDKPETARPFVEDMAHLPKEELRVLILATDHRVVKSVMVARGTLNSAPVRIAEVFREAIIENASGIIIVHNHPSGSPTPSREDIEVTREMVEAGQLLGIEVLDHLLVSPDDEGAARITSLLDFAPQAFRV